MLIKKLEKNELYDAYLISTYCFHSRVEDTESVRKSIESGENRDWGDPEKNEDWGAFDDDGTLMARIINNRFRFYLDGQAVRTGGVGAVSTLPEYRDRGAIREIFRELLNEAYRNGEVLSTLYPFSHEFYRKQGYEVVTFMNEYTLTPSILKNYRFNGIVRKWNSGDDITDFLEIYREFARRYNLAAERSKDDMLEHMKVDKPYMDRKFFYIFIQDGKAVAYLIFSDIRHDPAAILNVDECAWICREGFNAILGFLARFGSDYGEIKLPLPKGTDLLRIIRSPQAYDVQKVTRQDFMVRAVNVKKVLELIRKPADCDLTIKVTDGIIEENDRVFHVQGNNVEIVDDGSETKDHGKVIDGSNAKDQGIEVDGSNTKDHEIEVDGSNVKDQGKDIIDGLPDIAIDSMGKFRNGLGIKADIELSIQAFSQMAVGALNFDEALLREDVTVNSKEEDLRRVFVEKAIYVGEHF
ncbi:MAG: GNAT family N-acetyltransferase [Lachnospiraceae bacterium]|nr:GNAT family N-acetyltransferase [Lachnospiraceae bacterium]